MCKRTNRRNRRNRPISSQTVWSWKVQHENTANKDLDKQIKKYDEINLRDASPKNNTLLATCAMIRWKLY